MERTVLITGRYSSFSDDMVQEALARNLHVLATYDPADEAPEVPDGLGDDLAYIEWNRRSPISAGSVLLRAENSGESVEEAFVIYSPESIDVPFHETRAAQIEELVDGALKGYLFLLREVLNYSFKSGTTGVNIVIRDRGSEVVPPIEAALSGAFVSAAMSLMTFYAEESVKIRGFRSSVDESREYAKYIFDTIREKGEKSAGRWNKFSGRGSLFSFRK